VITGILLAFVAGSISAFFSLPMRHMQKWAWENIWMVWSVVTLIIIPWRLAIETVPNLALVYAQAGLNAGPAGPALGDRADPLRTQY
jgi:L-rhamnose-H+ transport protein